MDEGSTGTPGGDCTPGTPGNENRLLTEGNDVGEENGADCSGPADETAGSAGIWGAAEEENPGNGFGIVGDDTGGVPLTLCVVAAASDPNGGSGLPGSDTPGARGNEYISLAAGMLGPAAKGSALERSNTRLGVPGATVTAVVGNDCADAMSAPLGVAVRGDESAVGIDGNEYISLDAGSTGAAAQGPASVPSKTSDDEPSSPGGTMAGDASPVTPASEAAIARKSASFKGPKGKDEGDCGATGSDRVL